MFLFTFKSIAVKVDVPDYSLMPDTEDTENQSNKNTEENIEMDIGKPAGDNDGKCDISAMEFDKNEHDKVSKGYKQTDSRTDNDTINVDKEKITEGTKDMSVDVEMMETDDAEGMNIEGTTDEALNAIKVSTDKQSDNTRAEENIAEVKQYDKVGDDQNESCDDINSKKANDKEEETSVDPIGLVESKTERTEAVIGVNDVLKQEEGSQSVLTKSMSYGFAVTNLEGETTNVTEGNKKKYEKEDIKIETKDIKIAKSSDFDTSEVGEKSESDQHQPVVKTEDIVSNKALTEATEPTKSLSGSSDCPIVLDSSQSSSQSSISSALPDFTAIPMAAPKVEPSKSASVILITDSPVTKNSKKVARASISTNYLTSPRTTDTTLSTSVAKPIDSSSVSLSTSVANSLDAIASSISAIPVDSTMETVVVATKSDCSFTGSSDSSTFSTPMVTNAESQSPSVDLSENKMDVSSTSYITTHAISTGVCSQPSVSSTSLSAPSTVPLSVETPITSISVSTPVTSATLRNILTSPLSSAESVPVSMLSPSPPSSLAVISSTCLVSSKKSPLTSIPGQTLSKSPVRKDHGYSKAYSDKPRSPREGQRPLETKTRSLILQESQSGGTLVEISMDVDDKRKGQKRKRISCTTEEIMMYGKRRSARVSCHLPPHYHHQ